MNNAQILMLILASFFIGASFVLIVMEIADRKIANRRKYMKDICCEYEDSK